MCGIAGFIQKNKTPELLHSMMDTLAHRGPDGSGCWFSSQDLWQIHLGHQRLAIIDIQGGQQPLGNEDSSMQISFNGEIFNFLDLRAELLTQGHRLWTQSDTEVLLHHCEQHGIAGLSRLNGMFAFALWNQKTGELWLVRDRAGIKPLYYASLPDGGILFASELGALLKHPEIRGGLNPQALASYFFLDYIHPPQSLLGGIHKLPPASFVSWKNGVLQTPKLYWEPPKEPTLFSPSLTDQELAHTLRHKLERSIQRQLIADVPVGIFLSGGIDSSAITALASKNSQKQLQTFSITFEEEDFNEGPFAREVAKKFGTLHTEETLSESRLLEVLDAVLDRLDEPLADPSLLPTTLLSELASKSVKVVLGGDGGDELWGGYPTYFAHRISKPYSLVPSWVHQHMITPLVARLGVSPKHQSLEWKLKHFFLRWDANPLLKHLRWMASTDLPDLTKILKTPTLPPELYSLTQNSSGEDLIASILKLDFNTYLPGSVLTKVDRASMAHSLEVRPPFLDAELLEWSLSLPSHYKLRGFKHKYLLKLALQDLLPPSILQRPKKGFGIPLIRWIKSALQPRIQKILKDSPLWETDILNRNVFTLWNDLHQRGQKDYSRPLWALLILDGWARRNPRHLIAPR